MNKAIIISGATACGKSSLALEVAQIEDVIIINADALQIYQGLPILSAQPSLADQQIAPHILYSYFKSDQACSVGTWLELVKAEIKKAFALNKLPLIVGGSGMYISKLIDGIAYIPPIDEAIKNEARQIYEEQGSEQMIKLLIYLGEDFEKIKNLDKQRLIRVYEVIKQTGKSIFYWQQQNHQFVIDPKIFVHVNLDINRNQIYENCNLRFENMLKQGAFLEVENLMKLNLSNDAQIKKTLGYFEIENYLQNKIAKEEMKEQALQKTRNYAKRQMTWFHTQFENKNSFSEKKDAFDFIKNSL